MDGSQPLFPRLNVKEPHKVGPRAPPRNKMALYEQFTVPSHSFQQQPWQHHQQQQQQQQQQHGGGAAPSQNQNHGFVPQGCYYFPYYMVPSPVVFQAVTGKLGDGHSVTETTESEVHQGPGPALRSCAAVPSCGGANEEKNVSKPGEAGGRTREEEELRIDPRVGNDEFGRFGNREVEESEHEGNSRVIDNQSEEEAFVCSRGYVEDASDDSATSVLEDGAAALVTSMEIKSAFGDERFWTMRKAMQRQQKIFQNQLFELHRLMKVQKLMSNYKIVDNSEPQDKNNVVRGNFDPRRGRFAQVPAQRPPTQSPAPKAPSSRGLQSPAQKTSPSSKAHPPAAELPSQVPTRKPPSQSPSAKASPSPKTSQQQSSSSKSLQQSPSPKPSKPLPPSPIPPPAPNYDHSCYSSIQNPMNYPPYPPQFHQWFAPAPVPVPVPMPVPFQHTYPAPYYPFVPRPDPRQFVSAPFQLQPWPEIFPLPPPQWPRLANHPESSLQASSTRERRSCGINRHSQAGSSGFSLIQRADSSSPPPSPPPAEDQRQVCEEQGSGSGLRSPSSSRPSGFQSLSRRNSDESRAGAIKVTPRAALATAGSAVGILESIQQERPSK